jgi:hypothetical protein
MTQLSRLATLGIASEGGSPGTYVAPTFAIPFLKADFEDATTPLEDKSYRGNDTDLQGLYAGVKEATWDIDVLGYPDLLGVFLRSIIGPDTVTAGVATTLSATTAVGATSITTAATIPVGSTVSIGTAGTLEYFTSGTPTGSGPYTIPVTSPSGGLLFAHTSGVQVSTPTTHTFKQSSSAFPLPTYSLTVYDTLSTLGYSYAKLTDFDFKIDPKASISLNAKLLSMPGVSQTTATENYTTVQPVLGWQWAQTNAGASSTRGLSLDLQLKRAGEAIHASNGVQAPREIFTGVITSDGTYKAIFENASGTNVDLNLFANYTQQAATATLTKPVAVGGESIAITMSKSGWKTAKRDLSQAYSQIDFSLSGIFNTTDGGAVSAVLTNWVSAQYT